MAILPVFLALMVTSWRGTTELRKAIGNNFEGLAREAASKTDLGIGSKIIELRYLVEEEAIQSALKQARRTTPPPADPLEKGTATRYPEIVALLDRTAHLNENKAVQSIMLTDATGIPISASSSNADETSFFGETDWWRETAARDKDGAYVGNLYRSDNDLTDFLFDIAVPIRQRETGLFLGVIKETLHLRPFLNPFIDPIRFGKTGHAMLIDASGTVLICPILATGSHVTDSDLLQKIVSDRPGWITAHNDGHGGTNAIVGFAPVPAVNRWIPQSTGKQWHSFIRQEPSETYAPLQSLLKTVFLYGTLLVGATCFLGFVVSRRLVEPLLLLHEGAEHIRKGDLGHRLRIKTNDEIEALADKFNEMAEKLSESYSNLEEKVSARTRELSALNQIAATANQSLALQEILDSTLQKVAEATGFESAYVELIDSTDGPADGKLILKSHFGISPLLLDQVHNAAEDRRVCKEVIETRAPVILKETGGGQERSPIIEAGYQTLIAFPIQSKNRIVGVFTLAAQTPRHFTAEDLQFLSSIGNEIGNAVENARLYQKEQETVEKWMETDRIKSEFLSNTSHELRTPLTSIIGFSEILLDRLAGDLTKEQETYIRNMHTSGQHLLEIINNLLDLSKIKAGKMELHLQPFRLRSLVEGIRQTILPMIYKKNLRFQLTMEEGIDLIVSDEGKMKQILLNLLGNAVKFTPTGGTIDLRIGSGEIAERPAVKISVRDTGIGIPQEAVDKIFDEFQQVDGSYTRDHAGTGLGLAITKRFVDLLGGTISVESRLGMGSTFTVSIPFSKSEEIIPLPPQDRIDREPAAPVSLSSPSPPSEGEQPSILVVEDDPAVAKLLALYLTQEGYTVVHASDGEEAVEKAKEIKPFAITLDIMLPRIDGWEVLKKLKSFPATRDIPVIIVSIIENPTLGFSLGAVDYFTKPIDRQGLIESLRKYSVTDTHARKPTTFLVIEPGLEPGLEPSAKGSMEPNIATRERIGTILVEERFGVIKTDSGEEGLSLAVEIQPDLILIDLMLEKISGIETIHRLKQHPTAKNIPILLFSSRELTQEEKQILDGQVREILYQGPSLKEALIEEVRKFEKLYPDKAKMVDGLTGLYNERYLANRLADEANRAVRYRRPFSLLLSNLDQFRLFNRHHGTDAGNHLLKEIALLFRKSTRASNPLCRCGGSTFALLMPETAQEAAVSAAQKLRRLVEGSDFSIPGRQTFEGVTVSVGVATFFDNADTAEKMMVQAGVALKQAREQGGNRIITFDRIEA